MKPAIVAALAIAFLATEALAYETSRKGRDRMPGDEGFANQWFSLNHKVRRPNTAFYFIPLTPAPGGRPQSLVDTPHRKSDQ